MIVILFGMRAGYMNVCEYSHLDSTVKRTKPKAAKKPAGRVRRGAAMVVGNQGLDQGDFGGPANQHGKSLFVHALQRVVEHP